MNDLIESSSARPASAATPSLGMPNLMSAPGVCRGALAHWRQLQAAMQALQHATGAGSKLPRDFFHHCPSGSAEALRAALAIDASYLLHATPPADFYARFTWLALRVYQSARSFSVTLDHLPDLVADLGQRDPAAGGTLVQQMLVGPTGLANHARTLAGLAAAFATDLHTIEAQFGCDLAQAQAALPAALTAAPAGTADLEYAMGTHARLGSQQAGPSDAGASIAAATVTVLAVIGNMAAALGQLAAAWHATLAQLEAVAALPAAQLGAPGYLQQELHAAAASKDWGAFADIIRQFIQPACG
jgi:hypothetical protein